ncbi:MAG: iron ABC transporter permease [Bacteroidaceae bacterium]|nr:iron ABC transporter permease [Bacteroidaceae bacterium]
MKARLNLILLSLALIALFLANLYFGAVHIPAHAVTQLLLGSPAERASWSFILWENRIPQAITATLSGAGLAASGLLLQTVFRNPLAGPSILGIDGGANLGVAVAMLLWGGTFMAGAFSLSGFMLVIVAAMVGAWAVMTLLIAFSHLLRSSTMLLIAGVMIGYLTSSFISLLNYGATEEGVRSLMVWGLGSFANVTIDRLPAFCLTMGVGILASLLLIKPLNALLLGENYAANLGIHVRRTRTLLLCCTGLLTATSTAFCGPIAFIGLAVPHIARLLLGTSDHRTLLPATLLTGGCLALLCNWLSTLPSDSLIPINVITPVMGAPVVIWVILKNKIDN